MVKIEIICLNQNIRKKTCRYLNNVETPKYAKQNIVHTHNENKYTTELNKISSTNKKKVGKIKLKYIN